MQGKTSEPAAGRLEERRTTTTTDEAHGGRCLCWRSVITMQSE